MPINYRDDLIMHVAEYAAPNALKPEQACVVATLIKQFANNSWPAWQAGKLNPASRNDYPPYVFNFLLQLFHHTNGQVPMNNQQIAHILGYSECS